MIRSADPNIRSKANRRARARFSAPPYRDPNRMERFFSAIKPSRRIGTRHEKHASNVLAIVIVKLDVARFWLGNFESMTWSQPARIICKSLAWTIRNFRNAISVNPKFDLRQLRMFVSVAAAGGLARAAEELNLSQPAASAQIKALESTLGVALFVRSASGLVLTRHGSTLLPDAQRILTAANELATHAKRLQGQVSGRLRLGAFSDPELLKLGQVMTQMLSLYPMIEIEIRHRSSLSLLGELRKGAIDAAFLLGTHALPGFDALPLKLLRYHVVAPAGWRRELSPINWSTIAKLPWISTPRGGSHYQMASELFARHRLEPIKMIEADGETAITSLVIAGVGLALMRSDLTRAAASEGTVIVLPIGSTQTMLNFITPSGRDDEPPLRAIRKVVESLWPRRPRARPGSRA
jgi:DNA-binding transcriptional LysR family regulator